MKKAAKIATWTAGVLAAALLASTVGWTPAREVVLLGPDGAPVGEGWVGYGYSGDLFNLVCSITWHRQGGLVVTDDEGRATIPGRLYPKRPLDGYLRSHTELVYAPELHNAGRYRLQASAPGRISIDPDTGTATLSDLAGDPEAWHRSMRDLESFVWSVLLAEPDRNSRVEATPEQLCVLAGHLRAEYGAFLARHGDRPRSGSAEAIADEPLWGPFTERIFGRDLDALDRRLVEACGP